MNNILISLPFIATLLLFWRYQQVNKGVFGPVSLLIFMYLVIYGCAIVIEVFGFGRRVFDLSLEGVAFLATATTFCLFAFCNFRDRADRVVWVDSDRARRILSAFFLVSNIFAILFFLPSAIDGLTGDVEMNRQDLGETTSRLSDYGLINTYFSTISSCFCISLVLGFSNLVRQSRHSRTSEYLGWGLIASSVSYVIYILAWVGRDGIVYWTLSFVFVYLVFKPALSESVRAITYKFGVFALITFLPFFFIITIGRFGGKDMSVPVWILIYAGEQVNNFSDMFVVFSEDFAQHGALNFPLLANLVATVDVDRADLYSFYTDKGVSPWTFSTFVGSLYKDFGPAYTVVAFGIFFFLVRLVRVGRQISLSSLIVLVVLVQVPLFGVFYFRQYSTNFAILLSLLIAFFLRISRTKRGFRSFRVERAETGRMARRENG